MKSTDEKLFFLGVILTGSCALVTDVCFIFFLLGEFMATVKPRYESRVANDASNHKPISLRCFCSGVMDHANYAEFTKDPVHNSQKSKQQHEFMRSRFAIFCHP